MTKFIITQNGEIVNPSLSAWFEANPNYNQKGENFGIEFDFLTFSINYQYIEGETESDGSPDNEYLKLDRKIIRFDLEYAQKFFKEFTCEEIKSFFEPSTV